MTFKITEIRDALLATFKTIKKLNGFKTDLPDSHVYAQWNPAVVDNTTDDSYPKLFLLPDSGEVQQHPNQRSIVTLTWEVVLAVKAVDVESDDPQEMLADLIADVVTALDANPSLQGTAISAFVSGFVTDGGTQAPEGLAGLRLEVRLLPDV